jgi:hypothetical protein
MINHGQSDFILPFTQEIMLGYRVYLKVEIVIDVIA